MVFGKHRIERYHQHDAGKHLGYQKEIHQLFFTLKLESGHPVAGQTCTCNTDNHGKDTCYQAVKGHSSEIVGSKEFAEGLQADWVRYPLGFRRVGLGLCLEGSGNHPENRHQHHKGQQNQYHITEHLFHSAFRLHFIHPSAPPYTQSL